MATQLRLEEKSKMRMEAYQPGTAEAVGKL